MDFHFPFNAAASVPEFVFLLPIVAAPVVLYIYFNKACARYIFVNFFFGVYHNYPRRKNMSDSYLILESLSLARLFAGEDESLSLLIIS